MTATDTAPADTTRDAILDAAEEFVLRRGYNGFSYQDVADRVGIRKASVHHHFAAKEDLGVALLERRRARPGASLGPPVPSPRRRFEAHLRFYERQLGERDRLCFGGSLAAELDALPPRLRTALQDATGDRLAWLEATFRDGQADGTFRTDAAPEEQAALAAATLQGALQIARVRGSPEHLARALRQLRRILLA